MSNFLEIQISRPGTSGHITQRVEVPATLWNKWYNISFAFQLNDKGHGVADLSLMGDRYITVKERWYHRLISFIHFKTKELFS